MILSPIFQHILPPWIDNQRRIRRYTYWGIFIL